MQAGMTEILAQSQKRRVFKIVIEPIGALYQVIFLRKIPGLHGWERGKPHYVREDKPSLKRARRASLAAMERGA